jgi:response regulator of citrate/malate metabolism
MSAAINSLLKEHKKARQELRDEQTNDITKLQEGHEKLSKGLQEKRNQAIFALSETQDEYVRQRISTPSLTQLLQPG